MRFEVGQRYTYKDKLTFDGNESKVDFIIVRVKPKVMAYNVNNPDNIFNLNVECVTSGYWRLITPLEQLL